VSAPTNYLHLFEVLQEEAARGHASLRELVETLGAYVNETRCLRATSETCSVWKVMPMPCR